MQAVHPSRGQRHRTGVTTRATSLSVVTALLIGVCASPSNIAAAERSLCVVDDSKDMVDRPRLNLFNGFSTVDNQWPILAYLLPQLACDEYCSWTAFRTHDASCKPAGTIEKPRIPQPLQETSPLASVISQASQRALGRDVFFVTNGIDWLLQGGQYAVEMNVGGALANWLTPEDLSRDIILGLVQDNVNRARRPNMVIGFVRGFTLPSQADPSCTWSPVASPPNYRISLTTYRNPALFLTEGALEIDPRMTLVFSIDGARRTADYKISDNGRVELPPAILHNANDLKLTVTFLYPAGHTRSRFCWGIQGQFDESRPLNAMCKPSSDGSALTCDFPVPLVQGSTVSSLKLAVSMVPQKTPWLDLLDATHALQTTFNSFYAQLRSPTRLRVRSVKGPPNPSVNSLTIISR